MSDSTIITPETATDVWHVESNTPIEETLVYAPEIPAPVSQKQLKPTSDGRVLGVSKKLTSALSAGIFYLTAVNTMPEEVLTQEVFGLPISVWVAGFLGILNGLYIIVQGKIDAQN